MTSNKDTLLPKINKFTQEINIIYGIRKESVSRRRTASSVVERNGGISVKCKDDVLI